MVQINHVRYLQAIAKNEIPTLFLQKLFKFEFKCLSVCLHVINLLDVFFYDSNIDSYYESNLGLKFLK